MSARIEVLRGDITLQHVDAIVNAANRSLLGGGGVDGAIHQAAGVELIEQCRDLRRAQFPNGLPTGQAVATPAGALAASWVIHTVGPKYWEHPDGGRALLAECYRNAIAVAAQMDLRSIAFPAISCGVYGWKPSDAAPVAHAAVREALAANPNRIACVRFVMFNEVSYLAFQRELDVMSDV
jgi:O-acetyl-ADP-ribose deacetylase (regulator of RNase III)